METENDYLKSISRGVLALVILVVMGLLFFVWSTLESRRRSMSGDRKPEEASKAESRLQDMLDSGKLDEVMVESDGLLARKPYHVDGHYYKGMVYYLRGQYAEALPLLKEAKRLEPSWSEMLDPYISYIEEAK